MNNGNNWRPRLTSGCRNNRRPHSPWTSHFFPRRQIFWIRRLCRPRKFPHRRQAPWNAGGLSTDAREDAVLANGRLARRTSATMATLWPGDGCSVSCQIECGWECAGGGRRQRTCALQQGAGTRCWEGRRSAGRRQRGAVVHGFRGFIV